jgi:hypothetical protein
VVCSEVLPFSRSVRSSPQLGAAPDLFDQETQRWSLERQAQPTSIRIPMYVVYKAG